MITELNDMIFMGETLTLEKAKPQRSGGGFRDRETSFGGGGKNLGKVWR
ncbi:MAG: hypothetical protein AB1552_03680 [Nitrospirota bacterium]